MAKLRKTSKVDNLAFLLNPDLAVKSFADIDPVKNKTEHEFIKNRLDAHLKNELAKLSETIIAEMTDEKDAIKSVFARLNFDFQANGKNDFADEIIGKIPRESKFKNRAKLEDTIRRIAASRNISSLLFLDTPLKDNPLFADDFSRAKTFEYAKIIKLSNEAAKKLADKNIPLENLTETTLSELVKEKIITDQQKGDLLLSLSLGRLTGENFGLLKELKTDSLKSPVDFASWNAEDWETFIKDNRIPLPKDETDAKSYAENLRETAELSFPTEYFLHRTIKTSPTAKTEDIVKIIAPLFKNNEKIIAENSFEILSLEWKGISAGDKKKIENNLTELKSTVNTYRNLGIGEILNQKDANLIEKQAAIKKRFESLGKFYENNPEIDLNTADFSTKNAKTNQDEWRWTGIGAKEKPFVKKQMAAFQRAFVLGESYETAELLLNTGFDSANAVFEKTEEEFLRASGLNWETGRKVYDNAQELTVASTHLHEVIRDAVKGTFNLISVGNQSADLVNDLREIDGFDELFGSQDFCDCEECKSILSPAAYFTDLMYFVQENISKKAFIPNQTNHPLYLKRRRPDLWTVKLTCQNTTTEIPYLEVVNDVLEKFLTSELSVSDVYKTLFEADLSSRQPFNLPLEETRLYLSHFGLRLDEVYKTLKEPKASQYREKLNLSVEELEIITTPNPAGTKKRFQNTLLNDFDLQDFIRLAGISRSELDDLLETKFLPAISQIDVKQIKDAGDIQKFSEVLDNLTDENLDLIHRFVRLWKKTEWTIREFDLILKALKAKAVLSDLEVQDEDNNPKILILALIIWIQERLDLSVEEIAAIINELPQTSIKNDQSLFMKESLI